MDIQMTLNDIERGQLAIDTVQCFTRGEGSLSALPGLIKIVIEERVWERRLHHGRLIELPNLRALITSKPIAGWGQDPKKIEAVIKDDAEALVLFREAMKEQGNNQHTKSKGYNVTDASAATGNSRAYSISRVQKACDPETVKAVLAGDLSPNAALIRAGIRTNRTIYLTKSMFDLADRLAERLTAEDFALLSSVLASRCRGEGTAKASSRP